MMIETERLIIRLFREEDAGALYRIKADPQVMKYAPDFLDVGAKQADMPGYILAFRKIEEDGDTDSWRCYPLKAGKPAKSWVLLPFAGRRCSMNMTWDG